MSRPASSPPEKEKASLRDRSVEARTAPVCRVTALIPAYNCATQIGKIVEELLELDLKVLVVDDGSIDDTASLASEAGATVVRLEGPLGKGSAISWGIRKLKVSFLPDWLLFLDGDGQHLAREAPRFLGAMDESVDMLIGNRLEEAGNFPAYRFITNRVGSKILRWISGACIPDTQCGYRAFRGSLLAKMKLESSGFEIDTEMLLKALHLGARWKTVPVSAVYAGQGSHFRPVADTYEISMAALRYARG